MNGVRAFRNGFVGNLLGEGFVLGGVFVIGQRQQVKNFTLIQCHWNGSNILQYKFLKSEAIILENI